MWRDTYLGGRDTKYQLLGKCKYNYVCHFLFLVWEIRCYSSRCPCFLVVQRQKVSYSTRTVHTNMSWSSPDNRYGAWNNPNLWSDLSYLLAFLCLFSLFLLLWVFLYFTLFILYFIILFILFISFGLTSQSELMNQNWPAIPFTYWQNGFQTRILWCMQVKKSE